MRSRSVTITNLEEVEESLSSRPSSTLAASKRSEEAASKYRRYSVVVTKEWKKEEERRKLKSIQKRYAEVWQENETSIVIKMLAQSMKEQDHFRTLELQKSLLELERKSDAQSDEESPVDFKQLPKLLPAKAKSYTIMPAVGSPTESVMSEGSPFSPTETEYLKKAIIQNTKQYDMQINVMIVGNSGVGKTSLMNSWLGYANPLKTKSTIGLDSKSITLKSVGQLIRYKFIDSDGEKAKEFIRKVYYDLSDAIIIMFDVTQQASFDDVGQWLKSIKSLTQKEPELFLVGSKVDQKKQRVLAKRLAIQYARQNKMHFHEISAKDTKGVTELLTKITSYVLKKRTGHAPLEVKEVLTQEKACAGCMLM